MYKIIIQVFCIILRLGVPWVCRLEHTLVWFLILLAFLWVYQLGHRPSWRPSDHQELTNGEPFPSSCFYCSFSWPFFFLSYTKLEFRQYLSVGWRCSNWRCFYCQRLFGSANWCHSVLPLAPCSVLRRLLALHRCCSIVPVPQLVLFQAAWFILDLFIVLVFTLGS